MNVFAFTRIKLTIFYVTAIMVVSSMFSSIIYQGITQNIERSFVRAENRLRAVPGFSQQVLRQATSEAEGKQELHQLFLDELHESKKKVFFHLLLTNLFIFLASSFASYALAGKTLQPIEDTLVEQKRFIADASHELRTPLTSLKTAIEVSLRDKKLDAQTKTLLRNNLEDVDALKELVDNLLQLASQESKTVVKQLIDIHEVMSRVIKTMNPIAGERGIKITSQLQHQQVLASEVGLQQLFTILLDNAIKYSSANGEVNISIVPRKRFVDITVSDTGIGINKKYLSHIFERFYRIDSSRTCSQKPGFGLGLSVAKQIVNNHKGSISVKSEIGKGSTFTISLPL